MEIVKLAEKELQDLIEKYPSLEFTVVTNHMVGFKPKEGTVVVPEVVASTESATDAPVVDAVTVEPTNPQP